MTSLTPAAMAARYGTSSLARRAGRETCRVTGRVSVSCDAAACPRPGKCLAVAATPACCRAAMNAFPHVLAVDALLL